MTDRQILILIVTMLILIGYGVVDGGSITRDDLPWFVGFGTGVAFVVLTVKAGKGD